MKSPNSTPHDPSMNMLNTLTPHEVLALAISIEHSNGRHYREWADRLRPFDFQAADLLDEMAEDERMHAEYLTGEYLESFEGPIPKGKPELLALFTDYTDGLDRYFFVISRDMQLAILSAALRNEMKTRAFYREAAERTYRPELKRAYKTLALFEEDHEQAIQDKIDVLDRQPAALAIFLENC